MSTEPIVVTSDLTPLSAEPRPARPPRPAGPAPRKEPRSPFLPPAEVAGPSLDELVDAQGRARPLALELLADPAGVLARIRDPQQLEGLVVGALAVVATCIALFAAVLMSAHEPQVILRAAGLATLSVLLGLAAALGPIYGTSVVMAARLPMGRLVAVLLASVATGALLLPALAPVLHICQGLDPVWAGPLAAVGSFAIMGGVAGLRLRRLLLDLAFSAGGMDPGARFRVGVLTRMALAFTGLTVSLAFWAFDAFLAG